MKAWVEHLAYHNWLAQLIVVASIAFVVLLRTESHALGVGASRLDFDGIDGLAFFGPALAVNVAQWLWARKHRIWAVMLATAPAFLLAIYALSEPGEGALAFHGTQALVAVAVLSMLWSGPAAWVYWVLLAVACVSYAQRPGLATLLALLGMGTLSALGLVEAHGGALLARFVARRDPSTARQPYFYLRPRVGLSTALVAACALLATWLVVSIGLAAYNDARESVSGSRDASTRAPQPPSAAAQQWMDSLSLGSQAPQLTSDVLARAVLSDGRSGERILDGRVVYFTVTTLDDFGSDRLQRAKSSAPSVLRDELDGEDDGWIELARPNARAPLVIASITQLAPRKSTASDLPLLRLQPLLAVRAEEVAQLDDGTLLASAAEGRLEYAVAADPRTPQLTANFSGDAQHFDPRYLALPTADPALERIVRVAQEWSDQAESDAECALAIVERFRNDFTYSLEGTGAEGLEGLARCLDRRAGYCTPIAATCVAMLRSQGIPSRAVAGLLGKEFDSETGAYILRQRHGHAWVEAHFEGLGWVRLEPTPSSDSRTSGVAAGVDPLDDVGAELAQQVQSLASGDVSVAKLRELGAQLARGPSALAQAVAEGRTAALAVVGALGLAVLVWLLRPARRAMASAREAATPLGRARAYEERLIEALVKLGARNDPASTLREIAASAALRLDAELEAALQRAVELLYAARFGGATLERDERQELDELLRELKAAHNSRSELEAAPAT